MFGIGLRASPRRVFGIGKALQAGPNTRSALVGRVRFCSWNVGRESVAAWADLTPAPALAQARDRRCPSRPRGQPATADTFKRTATRAGPAGDAGAAPEAAEARSPAAHSTQALKWPGGLRAEPGGGCQSGKGELRGQFYSSLTPVSASCRRKLAPTHHRPLRRNPMPRYHSRSHDLHCTNLLSSLL